MSTLSSSSTLTEIQAAYDDNASYLEDGSTAKCKAFITAVRLLIRRTAQQVSNSAASSSITIDINQYREELRDARKWLAANGGQTAGGSGTKYLSIESFRS